MLEMQCKIGKTTYLVIQFLRCESNSNNYCLSNGDPQIVTNEARVSKKDSNFSSKREVWTKEFTL